MSKHYPNLELIEYKCKEYACRIYQDKLSSAIYPTYIMDVFLQLWPNTATGFDLEGGFSGQALTGEYTTVCEISWCKKVEKRYIDVEDKIYGVFFGERLAYMCLNPGEQFIEDLRNRNMPGQREAAKKYAGYITHEKTARV